VFDKATLCPAYFSTWQSNVNTDPQLPRLLLTIATFTVELSVQECNRYGVGMASSLLVRYYPNVDNIAADALTSALHLAWPPKNIERQVVSASFRRTSPPELVEGLTKAHRRSDLK
jgi:hypothetical protein